MQDSRYIRKKWVAGCLGLAICIILLFIPAGWAEEQWRIRINIPEYKLYLYQDLELYGEYPIAVGKKNSPSPTGNFTIINKLRHPTWYPPDRKHPPVPPGPKNPLGKFWLGLNVPGYGIHGNSASWSIGSPISLGCFRMHNRDIEQLFRLIPIGTSVEVVYQTVIGWIDTEDQAWLRVFPDIYRREKLQEELEAVFNQLHWTYLPHHKALQSLLPVSKRPGMVQVPRVINIAGDIPGIDGFVWNGTVYISRNILSIVPLTSMPETVNSIFEQYLDLPTLGYLTMLKFYWKEAENTLVLMRVFPEYFP